MNKKIILLALLRVFASFVSTSTNELFAQKLHVAIEWNENLSQIALSNGKNLDIITFKGAYNGESNHFLPSFQSEIPVSRVGEINCILTNIRYETTPFPKFAGINFLTENYSVIGSSSYEKKTPKGFVSLVPLRKNPTTGQIERIISCDIEFSINSTAASTGSSREYASNSVLSQGSWYKIAVTNSGMYKLDHDFLANSLHLDLNTLNLNKIGIFGKGGAMLAERSGDARTDDLKELSIQVVDKNSNGKMDADDYIYFYAEGPLTWKYSTSNSRFEHRLNLYDSKAYYYFTSTEGTKKSTTTQASTSGGTLINTFADYGVYEIEKNNLIKSGRTWYGKAMTNIDNKVTSSFSFPNIVTGSTATLQSYVAARSTMATSTMALTINGTNILNHSISTVLPDFIEDYANNSISNKSFTVSSSTLNIEYNFSNADNSAIGWINYLELNVERNLTFTGDYMSFRTAENIGTGLVSKFQLANAPSQITVWDISDLFDARTQQTTPSGSTQEFSLNTPFIREFIAFNQSASSTFPSPSFVETVENQNLHAIAATHPDMIIVAPKALLASAENLANFHRNDGLVVSVVANNQIYNEFGAGIADPTAIRDFVKLLYDKAGSNFNDLPQYLLLYADASFDPQTGRTQDEVNLIPTYESDNSVSPTSSYCSDDYFACLDANEGGNMNSLNNIMDIAVGRIPVRSVEEANDVNNKIFHYKSAASLGNWRSSLTYIADDEDANIHVRDCDNIAENVRTNYPNYNIDKIYLDAFREEKTPAGDRYPDVNTAIKNKLFQGSLIVTWTGHGGVQNWAHERIFDVSDINGLKNIDKLPLFFTATCDFSKFDEEGITTAGERLLTAPNGGAIALVTTVRVVYSSSNAALNTAFSSMVFEPYYGKDPTIGELVMRTKNNLMTALSADPINTHKFTMLGDPALTLNYPKQNIVTTKINSKTIPGNNDTLSALEYVTIEGEIRDDANNKISDFNGEIFPTVFDKLQALKTQANDGGSIYNFQLQKNAIFKGKASVVNGSFSFSFIVPKDIDYSIGIGKISYYADNGSDDAAGHSYNAYIGGVADSFGEDKVGPKVMLYMNDEKFAYGGITDENPVLLVKLSDENGINTAGIGIGHDISCIIDNDEKNKITLNDFYEGELNNYKKGNVKYPFYSLNEGKHTIEVKAWDVYNNSSSTITEFIVAKSAELALAHVLNYPNPFTTSTNFMFELNRIGENLDVSIQIFTVSGKVVKTIHENIVPEGYRVDNIHWDGRDEYGDKIGKGVYIYKVSVRSSDGKTVTKFEKLVLLQ